MITDKLKNIILLDYGVYQVLDSIIVYVMNEMSCALNKFTLSVNVRDLIVWLLKREHIEVSQDDRSYIMTHVITNYDDIVRISKTKNQYLLQKEEIESTLPNLKLANFSDFEGQKTIEEMCCTLCTTSTTHRGTGADEKNISKEYPNINKATSFGRRLGDPTLLVLHITAGNNVAGAMSVLFDSKKQASWHYIIPGENDKEHGKYYYTCIPLTKAAWHVRSSCTDPISGKKNINERSVGIEVVNLSGGKPISDWQYEALASAIHQSILKYPSIKNIAGHSLFDPDRRKFDPGTDIELPKLIQVLNNNYGYTIKMTKSYMTLDNRELTESGSGIKPLYYDIIFKASTMYGIPMALIAAVIKQESDFDKNCTGAAGEYGLMQILPSTAKILKLKNHYDPYENIMAGCKFLRDNYVTFKNWEYALAAYNWGPGNMKKNQNDYFLKPNVVRYVSNVLKYWDSFKGVYK